VLTVKNAMAPVLARVALLEQENAHLKADLATVTELRERVVVVETKAAIPPPVPELPELPDPVDLAPVLQRLDRLELLSKLADTKQEDVVNRLDAVEAKAANAPDSVLSATEVELLFRKSIEPVQSMVAEARERLIAVETRAPIPGPAGRDGIDGKAGADGQPGRDGLGLEDMTASLEDRTLTLTFERGTVKKAFSFPLDYMRYEGVFIEGKSYQPGAVTTWAGSTWHANKETSAKPGEGSKDWTLIVKRGRDGKDGKDADGPLPVVKR
jgi:hypothetical protein